MLQVVAATILFGVPIRLWGLQLPEPVFAMAPVFAWAVIRPSVLAPFSVILLGLFLDVFWGGPMGLWPLCLLACYGLALAGRSMMSGQSRNVLWVWYALLTAIAMGVGYVVMMLKSRAFPGVVPLAWQYLATIVLYPFAHRLIDMFEDADVRFR
jgi:rod shape-determining protein MreD